MSRSRSRQPANRLGYLWLGVGAVTSLFAVDGRWDVAPAAWLYGVFLLRYTRTRRPLIGFVGVWVASAVAAAFFLYESGLDVLGPVLLLCLTLSTVLTLPYLVDRLVAPRLSVASPLAATLVFPLSRVGAEYAIATLSPAGNIFGSLAATQHDNLPLLQVAAVTGSYGVTFLIAWFAAACNGAWEHRVSWPRIRTSALTYGILLALVVIGGGIRLAAFPPSATAVRVAGISPSASATAHRSTVLKGFTSLADAGQADPAVLRPIFAAVNDGLLAASEREARAGARVIAWPEAGAAILADDKADLITRAGTLARNHGVYLAMGLGVLNRQAPFLRNQAILLDPQGNIVWTYDKARPVPGLDDLMPGDGRVPTVDTPYGRLATLICFDADFPTLARQGGRHGVDLMLVPSNDWREFGGVHTRKATLRAIENGYSLVRPDSNGLAQTVDYQGRVLATSDYFTSDQQTMIAYVPTKGVRTIYGVVGDVFAWLCLAALALLTGMSVSMALRRKPARFTSP
jgi:apolipoprotein N-acyltransferase